jgi:hypothetical protein
MAAELVLRCPDHPTYTGREFPSHTLECQACARLSRICDYRRRAADCENWLRRDILRAKAEYESWSPHKRATMNFRRIQHV